MAFLKRIVVLILISFTFINQSYAQPTSFYQFQTVLADFFERKIPAEEMTYLFSGMDESKYQEIYRENSAKIDLLTERLDQFNRNPRPSFKCVAVATAGALLQFGVMYLIPSNCRPNPALYETLNVPYTEEDIQKYDTCLMSEELSLWKSGAMTWVGAVLSSVVYEKGMNLFEKSQLKKEITKMRQWITTGEKAKQQ